MAQYSCSSPEQILHSPLNTSHAKYHYSFGRQPRFSRIKYNCQQAHYDYKSQLSSIYAKVGTGPRSDFTKTTSVAPPPTKYQIESKFELNSKKNKGQTFGMPRVNMRQFGHVTYGILNYPGVGQYQQPSQQSTVGFSMRPKTSSKWLPPFLCQANQDVPGPGTYEQQDVQTAGKSVVARYRSVRSQSISKTMRFQTDKFQTPGPTQYTFPDGLNPSGSYHMSWYRGDGKRLMSKEERRSFIDQAKTQAFGPGPGHYRQPSEFGHYDQLEITNKSFYKLGRPRTASVGIKRQ